MRTQLVLIGRLVAVILVSFLFSQKLHAKDYLETLAVFTGDNGAYPVGLVETPEGDLYGVTSSGGKNDKGTLFEIPLYKNLITLIDFDGANGAHPSSRLLQTDKETFYGTTSGGGENEKGTVFRLVAGGKLETLVSFHGPDGAKPESDLLAGADGIIYGCTTEGGANNLGTIFEIAPQGGLKTLATFNGTNGSHPLSITLDDHGNVYGITGGGGTDNQGTVFMMTPDHALTTLYSFSSPAAVHPGAYVSFFNGDLYGTTADGGEDHLGSLFRMTTGGVMTDVVSFDGIKGEHPGPDIVQWQDSYFTMERMYQNMKIKTSQVQWQGTCFCGTVTTGGDFKQGSIYLASPAGAFETLASFTGIDGMALGSHPNSLLPSIDGNLVGTTTYGGRNNLGTIFRLEVQVWKPPVTSVVNFLPPIVSR